MNDNSRPARDRILEAAFVLFSERGIDATTTREVAQAAGVNEVTLFRHFGTKDCLVREVMTAYVPVTALPQLDQVPRSGDLSEDLRRLTLVVLGFHAEHEDFFRFTFANAIAHPEHRAALLRLRQPLISWWVQFFTPYAGRVGLNAMSLTSAFIGPILMRSINRIFFGESFPDSDEDFARTHAAILARALKETSP